MYEKLTNQTEEKIKNNRTFQGFNDVDAKRRINNPHDEGGILRSNFIKDIDKIMNCPFYPRYADKTQVFSLLKNDDITHRSMHVQFVSRIARTIGKALNLNLELIEAIAIGHDIGHTPFGHAGENVLDGLFYANAKRHFHHNVHSVRVLDKIFNLNLTMQTLDGIICHDGEEELIKYKPVKLENFEDFDKRTEKCYEIEGFTKTLVPCTLEGCVVRISDIIAYLGKDRQDAVKAEICKEEDFNDSVIGSFNAEIINNLTVNVIENSFGKDYISLDEEHFNGLKATKEENYKKIYFGGKAKTQIEKALSPMMTALYGKLLSDLEEKNYSSPIYTHHIEYINGQHYKQKTPYEQTEKNQIVVDYIASMTDDYFIELYDKLFPEVKFDLEYKGYFDK